MRRENSVNMKGFEGARVFVVSMNLVVFIILHGNGAIGSPLFPAMFVFGDSLVDCGNNNYISSLAKSNFYPYGIDFSGGPTGRFCNGATIIDFLGELIGLPLIPAFETTFITGSSSLNGVNYASTAAGILDETGGNLGDRFTWNQQVENFQSSLKQLDRVMDENQLKQHLAKSLVVVNLGSNDYVNNYLLPSFYSTSYTYKPGGYAHLLIDTYRKQILKLYCLGLRKFLLAGVGPLGCIPNQLASGLAPPGKCLSFVNDMVVLFNTQLRNLVDQLNTDHSNGTIFVYGNTHDAFTQILNNPSSYGFKVTDRGCCGVGRNRGQITCLPIVLPCSNRDQYIFWDAYHPTEAFNRIISQRAFSGSTSDCYPVNVNQMSHL